MLAAKTPPAKSKSASTTEKAKDAAQPSAETPINPVWGQLALSVAPKIAAGTPDDHHEKRAGQASNTSARTPDANARRESTPRKDGGIVLWDKDPARLSASATVVAGLGAQLGINWPMRIHIDDLADREMGGRSSLGAARGDSVFIRPRGFDPRAARGRRLLAHELAHAAQARIPESAGGMRTVAESEAGRIGDAFAAGRRVARPVSPLTGAAAAHDDDEKVKNEDEFLKTPKTFKMQITVTGIDFTPDPPDQKWVGNVDRQLQVSAVYVKGLVGPKNYSVQLVRDTVAYLKEHGGYVHINIPAGPATQDETCKPALLKTPLANTMVEYFTHVRNPPVPVVLTADQLKTIRAQADLKDIFAYLKKQEFIIFPWYTETIFTGVMLNNQKLLEQFQAAMGDDEKMIDAQVARNAQLASYEIALDDIRRDADLTGEPAYRALWNMPAKDPKSTEKLPPVDKTSEVNDSLALQFLLDAQAHYSVKEIEKTQSDRVFRKKVFDDWAARMKLKKIELEGDTTVRDAPSKAVQAPDPATMFSHPPLEPPYYDRQGGSEMLFWMNVYTPNMWEHFIAWHYYWEVIRVPHDDWSKREETAQDPNASGENYGSFGSIVGSRFRRNISNAEVDVKRSLFRIESILGPPGTGPASMALANAALSPLGSVIKTAFGKFSEKPWEYTAAIREPGVYVVRCRATRPEDATTLIHKMPSVAYMPIWVRKPEEITEDRVKVENVMAQMNDARLDAIQEKLKNENLPKDERQRLEDEASDIMASVYGNAETQLNTELRQLNKVKNTPDEWAKLDAKGQKSLNDRIDDINFILKKREGWVKDIGDDATGSPQKIVAYFIGQEGPSANRPMRLLLEIVSMKAASGSYRFAVLDSTSKESEHREGPEMTERSDAIAEAVRTLLEDVGYGRGKVTISIPKGAADAGAKAGEVRTIEIHRSDKQLLFEGLENLALVASIAAIVAAPFTAGESLLLLIPIGVVGAIPAAYRLSHRVSEGTFEWDMTTAMDILNVLGAVAGLGQFATSLKLIRVSTKVWMIIGLGMDGLQGIAGTYDLLDKLSKIDPTLPEGARMAEAMMIVGNALLQLGIMIGGRMVAEGQARKAKIEAKATPEANPNISRAPTELHAPLVEAGFKDIPVLVDKSIEGPQVEVHFEKDGYGLPSDVYIIAGKGATPEMIRLHVETVQLLQKYSGFSGWLRTLIDRFNALVYSKQFVEPGSRGWVAAAEVNKITKIVQHYTEEIAAGKVSRTDGESYLEYLKQELKKHEQALNEVEQGPGFIAAQAPKSADAVSHGYPPAPEHHYYVEVSPGVFELRAHVGYQGKPKMVVPKKFNEKGWDIIERPSEASVAEPGTTGAKPAAKPIALDPAQLQIDVSKALNQPSSSVNIVTGSGTEVRIIPPAESGTGKYVVHVPADATAGKVESAVARHNELAQQRPPNLSNIPLDVKKQPAWNGALEAEFRGRPAAEEGYHWRLQDGKLQYVREIPEEGAPAKPKMVWDDKLGALVVDTGAREAKAWPKDTPTSKATAFDDLGGNDPKSPFGKWVKLMEELGFKREDLIEGLQDPTGLNYDTVRHNLKSQARFQDAIRKWLMDPGELGKRYPEEFKGIDPADKAKQDAAVRRAQHRAIVDIDAYLALKDATTWTEKWYIELFGKVAEEKGATVTKVESQVFFDKEKLSAAGIDVSGSRQADVVATETVSPKDPTAKPVEKNVLKDVKSHEGTLTVDDKAQFADYKKLLGRDVPRTDGTTTKIDSVVEVFLDPRGAKANSEFIATELGLPTGASGQVSFEVFNTKGERRLFTGQDFQKLGNRAALQAAIIAYCDT